MCFGIVLHVIEAPTGVTEPLNTSLGCTSYDLI